MLDSAGSTWECKIHPYTTYKAFTKNFKIIGNRLFYNNGNGNRLYIPRDQRIGYLKRFHDKLGHMAPDSILTLIRRRCYWPSLERDLREYCETCTLCQLNRGTRNPGKVAHITPVPPVALPFERWGLDFIQDLKPTQNGNKHIVTAIDYATRWLIAKPVPGRDERTVLDFLYNDIIINFGCPNEILTDRGSSFLSEAVQSFVNRYQIYHLKTAPYHPQVNGMVERVHSLLAHSIRTLSENQPDRWDEFVGQAVFGIRIRQHSVTRKSPFNLLYGLEPRLPVDLEFPSQLKVPLDQEEREIALSDYNSYRLEQLGQDRASAYFKSLAQAKRMERTTQEKFKFEIGEFVKVRGMKRTSKFDKLWSGPYTVVEYGFPHTYWLMKPNGQRLESLISEANMENWKSIDDLNESNTIVNLENDDSGDSDGEDIPPEGDDDDSQ
jgi:transposase InsO family protein